MPELSSWSGFHIKERLHNTNIKNLRILGLAFLVLVLSACAAENFSDPSSKFAAVHETAAASSPLSDTVGNFYVAPDVSNKDANILSKSTLFIRFGYRWGENNISYWSCTANDVAHGAAPNEMVILTSTHCYIGRTPDTLQVGYPGYPGLFQVSAMGDVQFSTEPSNTTQWEIDMAAQKIVVPDQFPKLTPIQIHREGDLPVKQNDTLVCSNFVSDEAPDKETKSWPATNAIWSGEVKQTSLFFTAGLPNRKPMYLSDVIEINTQTTELTMVVPGSSGGGCTKDGKLVAITDATSDIKSYPVFLQSVNPKSFGVNAEVLTERALKGKLIK